MAASGEHSTQIMDTALHNKMYQQHCQSLKTLLLKTAQLIAQSTAKYIGLKAQEIKSAEKIAIAIFHPCRSTFRN
jgi:myo-inositol catabolism protein IolC